MDAMIKRLRKTEFTPQLTGYKSYTDINHGTYKPNGTLQDKSLVDQLMVPSDIISVKRKIGEGAFGIVLQGILSTDEGPKEVALKSHKYSSEDGDIIKELKLMRKIGYHDNVISLLGVCSLDGPLYIMTEYCPGGNLLDFLRNCRITHGESVFAKINEHETIRLALGVSEAMRHLTKCEIIHADLSARNILLDQHRVPKLSDFGLSRDFRDSKLLDAKSKGPDGKLPIKWMAMESLRHGLFTRKSDVWSFGVVMWEIVTLGGSPYTGIPSRHILNRLTTGYRMEKPQHCSSGYDDVMRACWEADPSRRIGFDEISLKLRDELNNPDRESYIEIDDLAVLYPFMDLTRSTSSISNGHCSS